MLRAKFAVMRRVLDERQWRLYLGTEARALGHGGIAAVARASGCSQATVAAGVAQTGGGGPDALPPGRARRPGAGRKTAEQGQPGLRAALRELAEASTRGDPMAAVTWCSQSLRDLQRALAARGFRCGKDAIARMLRAEGYRLQAMAKVLEGSQHPDRDAQFGHINAQIAAYQAAGDPVISVDAKKKELIGCFARPGQAWQPAGHPVRVRDHDFFPDPKLGKIVPYGVYDTAANRGFVTVGTSHDTAAFAVNAIRLWWQDEGSLRYPAARRLLITCDAGGSNGYRCRLWKSELARLAAQAGLAITVLHFPPGTSKWNKIEHRLFCHITRTWRARPLMTAADAVAGIAATITSQGLKCTAILDGTHYPDGIKISDRHMRYLETQALERGSFHGEWNYTLHPATPPGPEPAWQPAPQISATATALATLAAIPDLPALLDAITIPWQAAREQRLHLDRGAARRTRPGAGPRPLLTLAAATAATACHHTLGISYHVLSQALGVSADTIAWHARHLTPLLEPHGITPRHSWPRISTLTALHACAAASAITIPAPAPRKTPASTTHPTPPAK